VRHHHGGHRELVGALHLLLARRRPAQLQEHDQLTQAVALILDRDGVGRSVRRR
jgi:hypothetical protein